MFTINCLSFSHQKMRGQRSLPCLVVSRGPRTVAGTVGNPLTDWLNKSIKFPFRVYFGYYFFLIILKVLPLHQGKSSYAGPNK